MSSGEVMSPLPITGMLTAALTAAMQPIHLQTALPFGGDARAAAQGHKGQRLDAAVLQLFGEFADDKTVIVPS